MRRAVTIGIRRGCQTPVVITGPEVPLADHKTALKDLKVKGEHADFDRVEVWTSDAGVIAHKKLSAPVASEKPAADPAKESAADDKKSDTPKDSAAPAAKQKPAKTATKAT